MCPFSHTKYLKKIAFTPVFTPRTAKLLCTHKSNRNLRKEDKIMKNKLVHWIKKNDTDFWQKMDIRLHFIYCTHLHCTQVLCIYPSVVCILTGSYTLIFHRARRTNTCILTLWNSTHIYREPKNTCLHWNCNIYYKW